MSHGQPTTVTPMPLPISRNQLDKLGKRLAQPGSIMPEDYQLLERVLEHYGSVLAVVEVKINRLGLRPTQRLKTTGTLADKLRRSPHTDQDANAAHLGSALRE